MILFLRGNFRVGLGFLLAWSKIFVRSVQSRVEPYDAVIVIVDLNPCILCLLS